VPSHLYAYGPPLYALHMLLIGQYDSPFVRRTAIALSLYGFGYEHRPWSVWANEAELSKLSPLRRVPVLVLDDGEALLDSFTILDHLDECVGPERALYPAAGAARRAALRVTALATGLADKAISLFYEGRLHDQPAAKWSDRCRRQILETCELLERDRASRTTPFWFGTELTHSDIAVACALRFTREAHPSGLDLGPFRALAEHSARLEDLAVFRAIQQPFHVSD
jgi:glutathione S-transferase